MHTHIIGSTRPRGVVLSVLALVSWVGLPGSAHPVGEAPAECAVTSAAGAAAVLDSVRGQLALTETGLDGATVGSPAAWRLREQHDQLREQYAVLDQLRTAFAAKEGATSGSPAQWRAKESVDTLCEQLQRA